MRRRVIFPGTVLPIPLSSMQETGIISLRELVRKTSSAWSSLSIPNNSSEAVIPSPGHISKTFFLVIPGRMLAWREGGAALPPPGGLLSGHYSSEEIGGLVSGQGAGGTAAIGGNGQSDALSI